jgi:cell wall-associated NlpC family hydrolase
MNRTVRLILAATAALTTTVPLVGDIAAAAPSASGPSADVTTVETTITVQDGDSLAGLAWRHTIRLSALLRANSLEQTSMIHPGDTLIIPAGATLRPTASASLSAQPGSTSAATNGASTSSTAPGGTSYTIQAGDALSSIAWRHGVGLGALVQANGIAVSSLILPGQLLQVPPATRPIPTAAPTAATAAPAAAPAAATPAPTAAAAPASPGSSLQSMLDYATAQVGAPYRFFSAGPDAFDCSGLVVAAFREVGVSVPHQSRALAKIGNAVDWRSGPISAGDLVFTSAVGDPAFITHVGIALDSRRWVHAIGFGRAVSISSLPTTDRIMAVQRIDLP